MTIAFGSLLAGNGQGNGSNITTSTITPTAGRITLFCFYLSGNTGNVTVSGCNLTWTKLSITSYSGKAFYIFWGVGNSPTTGTLSTSGGNGGAERIYIIQDFVGVNTVSPVVQSKYSTGSSSSLSTTLGSSIISGNTAFGFGARVPNSVTFTAGTDFTKIGQYAQSSTISTEYQLNKTDDAVIDMTSSSSGTWHMIGLELQAAQEMSMQTMMIM